VRSPVRVKGGSYTWPITGTANGSSITLTTGPYNELPSYIAYFTGTISADSKTITGTWDVNKSDPPNGTFTATRPTAPTPGDPDSQGSPDTPNDPKGNAVKLIPGDIYVLDSGANLNSGAIYKVNPANGVATLVHLGPPFAGVREISFGPDGDLYATDIGAARSTGS
jgi:hypothetical protein